MYKVTKIVFNGATIIGYGLADEEKDESKTVTVAEIKEMIHNNVIGNASLIQDVVCIDDMNSIESVFNAGSDKVFTVESKIVNSQNTCVGYEVKNKIGKIFKISLQKAWELALRGSLYGFKAVRSNGVKMIVGIEQK